MANLVSSSSSLPQPSLSHTISVKLTLNNDLLWKIQLVPYLHGQRLYKFIDGTCPARKPEPKDHTSNPAYDLWIQQDQLVMSVLISSLPGPLMGQVVGCTIARLCGCPSNPPTLPYPKLVSSKPNSNLPISKSGLHLYLLSTSQSPCRYHGCCRSPPTPR